KLTLFGGVVVEKRAIAGDRPGIGQLRPEFYPNAVRAQYAVPAAARPGSVTIEVGRGHHLRIDRAGEWQKQLVGAAVILLTQIIEARPRLPIVQHADDAIGSIVDQQRAPDAVDASEQ